MTAADKERFIKALQIAASDLGVSLAEDESAMLWRHFGLVREANETFNLTRITDPEEAAVKLYADSLAPAAWADRAEISVGRCLDVGTGAGFPSVPLAVCRPLWSVTAIDSTGKKARFVESSAGELGISNISVSHARAGEWNANRRFDLVTFKAVGPIARCLSVIGRLVASMGCVVVFKGPGLTTDELDAGESQAESMGMHTWDTMDYQLHVGDDMVQNTLVAYRRFT